MERLTKKYDDGSYGLSKVDCEVEKKLGQLEDIEQELGIEISVLFKLSKAKNVYAYGFNEIIQCALISVNFKETVVWNGITKTHYQLSSYGKAFALTKEELEK